MTIILVLVQYVMSSGLHTSVKFSFPFNAQSASPKAGSRRHMAIRRRRGSNYNSGGGVRSYSVLQLDHVIPLTDEASH